MNDAQSFFNEHYEVIGVWNFHSIKKTFLGDGSDRACRFCGKKFPDVSFKSEAHAIPESLGNKVLFSFYECDSCNEFFGKGIENDFGNWSKPMRTFSRIKGKKGIPVIKDRNGDWRIEGLTDGLHIRHRSNDPVIDVDMDRNEITFRIERDPYIPIAVHKAFIKMGITLLPEIEICNFFSSIKWLMDHEHTAKDPFISPILRTFMPGHIRSNLLIASIIKRKQQYKDIPYIFLILMYSNEMFQIYLPSSEQDDYINAGKINIFRFPAPTDINYCPCFSEIDFSNNFTVRGDIFKVIMLYQNRIKVFSKS